MQAFVRDSTPLFQIKALYSVILILPRKDQKKGLPLH